MTCRIIHASQVHWWRISFVWTDVLRTERSSVIRTHLQFCYRAHDRVSQPRDAEFLQVSCFGFEEIAAVGRDSPIFPPFAKCCLAEYWRAGRTEKLNQITKWGWTAYFFTFISIVYTCGKQTVRCLRSQALRSHIAYIQVWTLVYNKLHCPGQTNFSISLSENVEL